MKEALTLALEMADAADAISSRYSSGSSPVSFTTKDDGSPVTAADLEIEQSLARLAAERDAGVGFLGEEVGATGSPTRRWIVDGIDGTGAFAAGRPEWATLVAYADDGEVVAGVVSAPAVGRRWWAARGEGAWIQHLHDDRPPRRLAVRATPDRPQLESAVVPDPDSLEGWRQQVASAATSRAQRPSAPGHGPLLVAAGQLDLSVHLWGGPWDHAAFAVLVEEAGGRFADLWGGRRLDTWTAVFGSPDAVHEALAALAPLVGDAPPST